MIYLDYAKETSNGYILNFLPIKKQTSLTYLTGKNS